MIAAMIEVAARPYRPPWIEPVCSSSRPNVVGATKPPRLPTELISAMTPAAIRASRYAWGIGQNSDEADLKPSAAKQIATKAKIGPPVVDMNIPAAAISRAAATQACWCFHLADSEREERVHADNRQQPRNRVEQSDLNVAEVAHLLDDAWQPEGRGIDGQLDEEVDQAEQDDLAVLEQLAR